MAREIVVVCDDNVDIMSITLRSKRGNKSDWAVGLFDVTNADRMRMPDMIQEPFNLSGEIVEEN